MPATTSASQNFLNINVTALVQDMISFPNQSFGFMLRLSDENYYRSVDFASSDSPDAQLRPKLVVTYVMPTGIKEEKTNLVSIYPNPFQESVNIGFSNPLKEEHTLLLTDITGKIVREIAGIKSESINLNRGNLPNGIYFLHLVGNNKIKTTKLLIE